MPQIPAREKILSEIAALSEAYAKDEDGATGALYDFGARALFIARKLRDSRTRAQHEAAIAALVSLADDHEAIQARFAQGGSNG